ncbi:unnamed protein product, partial [Thelazia callipaeda]|uniref:GOLGA2L5 domain-containing protein n=1 Tax=Thelazia callipaeda TaxID=103827 RepID=A0A0N5CSQ2_THECL
VTSIILSYYSACTYSSHNSFIQIFAYLQKCLSSHQLYGSNASSDSHHSSGIHVTPSPSDSGIVDYETIIRDKENELTNVRATMAQNEEIVVKVYQEKERLWKEQIADMQQKLKYFYQLINNYFSIYTFNIYRMAIYIYIYI